jgi:hypothetical protein
MSILIDRRRAIIASINAAADVETTSESLRDFHTYQPGISDFERADFLGAVESHSGQVDGVA